MPIRTSPWPTGVPCWAHLSANDPTALVPFYEATLGWSVRPEAADPGGGYLVAQVQGRPAAGLGTDAGGPPGWTLCVATSDLGAEAAKLAIERAGLAATDIGAIIVGTTTPDTIFPSTACRVQAKIGATSAWGFDLGGACSGFTFSLSVAAQLVASHAHEHVLVIGADVMSSIIDYQDRATCVLFGDGAGAVVVSASDDPELGILDFANEIDGIVIDHS